MTEAELHNERIKRNMVAQFLASVDQYKLQKYFESTKDPQLQQQIGMHLTGKIGNYQLRPEPQMIMMQLQPQSEEQLLNFLLLEHYAGSSISS